MTTIFPVIGYALMLIPMHFYNITGESHRKMMKDIIARRKAEGQFSYDDGDETDVIAGCAEEITEEKVAQQTE